MIQSRICPRSHGGRGSRRLYSCSNSAAISKVQIVGDYKESVQDSCNCFPKCTFQINTWIFI